MASTTEIFNLEKIRYPDSVRWSYFNIGTSPQEYDQLNETERRLAERVYGAGNFFHQAMELLFSKGIKKTGICLPSHSSVRKTGTSAQAAKLQSFGENSGFSTVCTRVNFSGCMRGRRRDSTASLPGALSVSSRGDLSLI